MVFENEHPVFFFFILFSDDYEFGTDLVSLIANDD